MTEFEIKPFDPQVASLSDFAAYKDFLNRIEAEEWPEDPPTELEELIRELRAIPPFVVSRRWVVWHNQEIIARGVATFWNTEDNKHLLSFDIAVLPEWRRQGLAKRLLKLIAEVAQKEKRRLLMTHTDSAIPAGEAFMKRLGARVGQVSSTNQLDLALFDRELLRRWQERAPKTEFELGLWEGPYPEEELDAIVKLREVMNTEPRDNLEIEDVKWTKEQLRQIEASLAERQTERWTIFVRGRGLGKWLKAAMLEKVLRDRPQVRRVRTGNANSNAPMLKINYELGFKPYKTWTTWQVELEKVLEYLKAG